jgi:nucleoside-diphosphate-sugar epimerase
MKIVVTGGTGFVGKALAARLAHHDHDVVLPLRRKPETVRMSDRIRQVIVPQLEDMHVADWRPVLAGADAVIHTAAIAHIGPSVDDSAYKAINRDASARLAEAAAAEGIRRFVFISSIRAQVGATSDIVQTERTPPAPTEAYGRSKLEAEGLIRQWLPEATILRPAVIVGPEAKGNLATLLKLAALPVPLPFGALHAPQAMVSLDGVIDAAMLALGHPAMPGQIYCLAERPHLSLTEVITALRQGLNRPRWLLPIPAPLLSLPLRATGKTAMAEKLSGGLSVDPVKLLALGWQPKEPLAAVLQQIGAAYAAFRPD